MNIPTQLKYTENDEWLLLDGDQGVIGISDHAQEQLSDIVFVEITVGEGDTVAKGDIIATVESVKAAADVYAPIGGTVVAINEALPDSAETINKDPYGKAWLSKITPTDTAEADGLMDASAYEARIAAA